MPTVQPPLPALRPPPLLLRRLPSSSLATPPRHPTQPAQPHPHTRHRLPMPSMRRPLPRRATLPRLQHLLPPTRARRTLPPLRRSSRNHRPHHRPSMSRQPQNSVSTDNYPHCEGRPATCVRDVSRQDTADFRRMRSHFEPLGGRGCEGELTRRKPAPTAHTSTAIASVWPHPRTFGACNRDNRACKSSVLRTGAARSIPWN